MFPFISCISNQGFLYFVFVFLNFIADIAKLVSALLATNNISANLKLIELKTLDILLVIIS